MVIKFCIDCNREYKAGNKSAKRCKECKILERKSHSKISYINRKLNRPTSREMDANKLIGFLIGLPVEYFSQEIYEIAKRYNIKRIHACKAGEV